MHERPSSPAARGGSVAKANETVAGVRNLAVSKRSSHPETIATAGAKWWPT